MSVGDPATAPGDGVTKSRLVAELATYARLESDVLLEMLIDYIESRIDEADGITSPRSMPEGVDQPHLDQIQVCLSRFTAVKLPNVSVRDYLERLHTHCPLSNAKILALAHYLVALDVMYTHIAKIIRKSTVHRLILTGLVVASKVLDDRIIRQKRWSIVGGISLPQLNGLELAFFFLLNGKAWLTEQGLIMAGKILQGRRRSAAGFGMVLSTDDSVIWSNATSAAASPMSEPALDDIPPVGTDTDTDTDILVLA
ncbi:hypothetical protein PYCC9005_001456 [Savitreella phatthalungensis]